MIKINIKNKLAITNLITLHKNLVYNFFNRIKFALAGIYGC